MCVYFSQRNTTDKGIIGIFIIHIIHCLCRNHHTFDRRDAENKRTAMQDSEDSEDSEDSRIPSNKETVNRKAVDNKLWIAGQEAIPINEHCQKCLGTAIGIFRYAKQIVLDRNRGLLSSTRK